ncbi:MAG: OmpA family protein [Bacteroidales bacterium]|nr:OmpA family protein [Bacteroidales bacterium]
MKRLFLILTAIIITFAASAQKISHRHGARLYKQLAYSKAIPYLKESYKVDDTNIEALRMLADSYRQINDVENMLTYYGELVEKNEAKPIEKYYYGQALMQSGKYEEAQKWLAEYQDDDRGLIQSKALSDLNSFFKDSSNYIVKNLEKVNSSASEISISFFGDNMLFSSNRYKIDNFNNQHKWTGKDFFKLYSKNIKDDLKIVKFTNNVQTKYNVGPVVYVENEKKLYLTRNQFEGRKAVKGLDKQIKLQIYTYEYDEEKDKWTNETPLFCNNENYNIAHAAVNKDGNILVISSDMPGGYGGMDLWISFKEDGNWTPLKNLGDQINTSGNEVFPTIYENDLLFFSSDGKEGLGGLDIYYCNFKNGIPKNLSTISYPVNTQSDDFGFVLTDDGSKAYFISNRNGGKGDDDIYVVDILVPFRTNLILAGHAYDVETKEILEGTIVELFDEDNNLIAKTLTKEDGYYEFEIEPDKNYKLLGNKVKYEGDEKEFEGKFPKDGDKLIVDLDLEEIKTFNLYALITDKETKKPIENACIVIADKNSGKELFRLKTAETGDVRQALENAKLNDVLNYKIEISKEGYLTKVADFKKTLDKPGEVAIHDQLNISLEKIEVGTDIGKIIEINPIYFDLDKSNIRPDAAEELDKIVKVMQENPTIVIELGSHTDCRASAAYNMRLSDRRAKSSAAYVISKGIDKSRIYGKGYGETMLVNHCECEGSKVVPCTEEEHQLNRRTEFIIVEM